MRWKILWLITNLVLIARTQGIRFNADISRLIVNQLSPTKPSKESIATIAQDSNDETKISASNFTANVTVKAITGDEKNIDTYYKTGDEDQSNSTNYEDLMIDASHTHVTTSSLIQLLRPVNGNNTESGRWLREAVQVPEGSEENEESPLRIVETLFGNVAGYAWPNSDEIISYYDIPYGQFNLFKEPVIPDSWDLHSVSEHSKRCPQFVDDTVIGDTDCLTLSIFTPKEATDASVFFYIHESSAHFGSGDPSLYGPEYLVKKGIILVLPNYRLGALGFLCLQNSTAPGNAAIKDLALALEWTKNNIEAFGGNPSNIVISGDGTSGALAGYLALTSDSKKHIRKVISESGSMLSHWAIDRTPISTAREVAEQIRRLTNNYVDDVFSDISIENLVNYTNSFTFKPCIEDNENGTIITSPWTTLKKEDAEIDITFLIGSANHAALQKALEYEDKPLSELNESFESILPNDLTFPDASTRNDVGRRIKQQYYGAGDIASSDIKNLSLYFTDMSYLGPDVRLARNLVAAGAKVYLYEFSYVGALNTETETIDSESRHGAIRGDVVGYLFSQIGRELKDMPEEAKVVDLMTNLWASFIKSGCPTAEDVIWNELNTTDDTQEAWLSISEEASLEAGFHYDRLSLWTDLYRDFFIERSATNNIKANNYISYAIVLSLINMSINAFI